MAVAGTSFVRSFPLELDAQHRSVLPRRGPKSHLMLRCSRQVFLVGDEERSDVSSRAIERHIRPEFRKTLLEQ